MEQMYVVDVAMNGVNGGKGENMVETKFYFTP
jgi:hypothetical protein